MGSRVPVGKFIWEELGLIFNILSFFFQICLPLKASCVGFNLLRSITLVPDFEMDRRTLFCTYLQVAEKEKKKHAGFFFIILTEQTQERNAPRSSRVFQAKTMSLQLRRCMLAVSQPYRTEFLLCPERFLPIQIRSILCVFSTGEPCKDRLILTAIPCRENPNSEHFF